MVGMQIVISVCTGVPSVFAVRIFDHPRKVVGDGKAVPPDMSRSSSSFGDWLWLSVRPALLLWQTLPVPVDGIALRVAVL